MVLPDVQPAGRPALAGRPTRHARLAALCVLALGCNPPDPAIDAPAPVDADRRDVALFDVPDRDSPEDAAARDSGLDALGLDALGLDARDLDAPDAGSEACVPRRTIAYAMHDTWDVARPENVVPMFVPTAFTAAAAETEPEDVARAAAAFFAAERITSGQRAMFDMVLVFGIFDPDEDVLPVPPGVSAALCPRYDWVGGEAEVARRYERFFAALEAADSGLDELHVDYEEYSLSTFGFRVLPRRTLREPARLPSLDDPSVDACAGALLETPYVRDVVAPRLLASGFDPAKLSSGAALGGLIRFGGLPARPDVTSTSAFGWDYLRWNALASTERSARIDGALAALATSHPALRYSAYQAYYQGPSSRVPDGDGHEVWRYPSGRHVGTHQSLDVYGNYRQLALACLEDPPAIVCPVRYGSSASSALRYEVLRLHGALEVRPDVPVRPWLAYRDWREEGTSYTSLAGTDLYQELVLHTLLSGTDAVYFFNPAFLPRCPAGGAACVDPEAVFDDADVLRLSALLDEVDTLLPCGDRVPVPDPVAYGDFREPLIVSSVTSGERVLHRVSPVTPPGSSAEPALEVSSVGGDVLVTSSGRTLVVPAGRVETPADPSLAPLGRWISQPRTAPAPSWR
jgi:hypothetical protein